MARYRLKRVFAWSAVGAMVTWLTLSCKSGPGLSVAASSPKGQQSSLDTQWCKNSPSWPLRDEHLIGTLPWAEGEEPIPRHYAGHIPIRTWSEAGSEGGEASLYYWFMPAIKPKTANPPLIVWLQGGPGSSSLIGMFFEMGPLWIDADMKLHRRNHSWVEDYSMLFIDQPVGTGYSYVTHKGETDEQLMKQLKALLEHEQDQEASRHSFSSHSQSASSLQQQQQQQQQPLMDLSSLRGSHFIGAETSGRRGGVGAMHFHGYVKDQRGVASDLMVFLHEFFRRYPEQRVSDLYLTGESYAGKFVPTFADAIMQYNLEHQQPSEEDTQHAGNDLIRLRGIALGNSLTDPVSQVQAYAEQGFYLGYLDYQQREAMRHEQQQAVEAAAQHRFVDSNKHRNEVFRLFTEVSGGVNWYDLRKGTVSNDWSKMEQFMNLEDVKDAMNVYGPRVSFLRQWACTEDEVLRVVEQRNETRFEKDVLVRETMASDIMRTSAPIVGRLLDLGIRVLAYQGIFDYRDAVVGSHYWIDQLPWYGQEQFRQQGRKLWLVDTVEPNHQGSKEQKQHVAGYVTKYDRLSKVAVLGAGHLAPMDQAHAMHQLIRSLIEGEELSLKDARQEAQKQHTI